MAGLYVQLDVNWPDDPRVIEAGNAAFGAYLAIVCWSVTPGWEGRVHRDRIPSDHLLDVLLRVGLVSEPDPGWIVPTDDWLVFGGNRRRWIPVPVRRAVMERDGYQCVQCGATDDLSLDHIIPHSLGGPETVDNLRVLCRPCNSRKGARV